MAKPTAVLYAQPGCGRCTAVKDLLLELGIDVEEKDTLNDLQALEELEHRGAWEAPITLHVGDFVLKLDTKQFQEFLGQALD